MNRGSFRLRVLLLLEEVEGGEGRSGARGFGDEADFLAGREELVEKDAQEDEAEAAGSLASRLELRSKLMWGA